MRADSERWAGVALATYRYTSLIRTRTPDLRPSDWRQVFHSGTAFATWTWAGQKKLEESDTFTTYKTRRNRGRLSDMRTEFRPKLAEIFIFTKSGLFSTQSSAILYQSPPFIAHSDQKISTSSAYRNRHPGRLRQKVLLLVTPLNERERESSGDRRCHR